MASANKTHATDASVAEFLDGIADPIARDDARHLCAIMGTITGEPATMWGTSIVGFGRRTYRYASGHSGETALIGFSPRTTALALYLTLDFEAETATLAQLGPHRVGKGCLYIKRLAKVDDAALTELVTRSVSAAHALGNS
ncbi:DUF1801 domain-containing protein [Rhodococcus sp. ABRD24]|uniref:DUF1801 domain-containing protein n=1 Tax=Rhodococcus sp. ABRD24 TaxID=2507582 RepID=UPI00103F322D|nr:DUF1801 domain-containing protein [Rhodococcus sp. ABRD24]QBJ94722.1 DUF1801 domain-containing protein [Rhodococcus sp. ABRD24]